MLNDGYSRDPSRRNLGGLYRGNQSRMVPITTSDVPEALIDIKTRARVGRISVTALEPIHKRPRIFQGERFCPSCGTKLNQYNKGPYCGPHTPIKTPRVRGKLTKT